MQEYVQLLSPDCSYGLDVACPFIMIKFDLGNFNVVTHAVFEPNSGTRAGGLVACIWPGSVPYACMMRDA